MRTYVIVSFWILIFGAIIRSIELSIYDYPRTETQKLGGSIVTLIERIALAFWAGLSLWW